MHTTILRIFPFILLLAVTACDRQNELQATGILEWDRIELTAEANEPIVDIVSNEGAELKAGQTIIQLDTSRIQAQLDEAAAVQDQAKARLAELQRGPRSERIQEAQARLRGSESELAFAETELQRIKSLIEKQLSAAETLDSARTQRARAHAARDSAYAALQELLAGTTVEELNQAEAELKQAEARLRGLEITFERLTIRAPRAGRLDVLHYELGEHPRTGDVVAVMLAGNTPHVRVYIPEPWRVRITPGTPALVWVDGLTAPFPGHVSMISRDAAFTPFYSLTEKDRSRLSYLAEVELEGENAQTLSSGIPVMVEFSVDVQDK